MTRSSTSLNDAGLAGGFEAGAGFTVAESGTAGGRGELGSCEGAGEEAAGELGSCEGAGEEGAGELGSCEKSGKTEANANEKNKSEPNRRIRIMTFWEYVMPTEK